MRYETLGRTGLKVSRLSFGASALGSVFRPVDESEGIRAVHVALDIGVNYFDVAPAYGGTVAETVLGKALRGVPRDRYYLSTKAGKFTDPEHYGRDELNYSRTRIRGSVADSMRRLGVDYFDIVHLHDFEYQGRAQTEWALEEGMAALHELKREGKIGAVSAGVYPMDLWHRILASVAVDAVLVHNHYCLYDTRATELLPAVLEKGIGLINGSPFGSGLLTGREPAGWHPALESDRQCFREAAAFCHRQGVPISKLAIQFASQHPQIPTTLFSSASSESVRRNVQWHEEPFDPALVSAVQEILAPVRDKQWDYDAAIERLVKPYSGSAGRG
jgi:L-galactose dehydrogenase